MPEYFAELLPRVCNRVKENSTAFVHPRDFRAALEDTLSRVKGQNALPTINRLVGRDSVNVFGVEQAIALLNDLDYQPRPVFQGYSAYTPFLVGCNRSFYLRPAAPVFVILDYHTADDRLAAEDDVGALEVILRNYRAGRHGERVYAVEAEGGESGTRTPSAASRRNGHVG